MWKLYHAYDVEIPRNALTQQQSTEKLLDTALDIVKKDNLNIIGSSEYETYEEAIYALEKGKQACGIYDDCLNDLQNWGDYYSADIWFIKNDYGDCECLTGRHSESRYFGLYRDAKNEEDLESHKSVLNVLKNTSAKTEKTEVSEMSEDQKAKVAERSV